MDSGKCLPRRRPRTIDGLAGVLLAAVLMPHAAAADEPPGVAALHTFLDTVETLTAEFEQRLYDADGELIEEAAGSFALERPDHFVWNYREPNEQVLLADGERLWTYDVELEQATVSPLEEGAGSPAMLLSGGRPVLDNFEIEAAFTRAGSDWVRLVPKLEDTDFRSVAIGFGAEGLPRELELVDGLDQTTRIEFSGTRVNETLEAGVFALDLPDDVDVIGAEG